MLHFCRDDTGAVQLVQAVHRAQLIAALLECELPERTPQTAG